MPETEAKPKAGTLTIQNPEHFIKAFQYALSISPVDNRAREQAGYAPEDVTPLDTFLFRFKQLQNWTVEGLDVTITPDFVPHSFYFVSQDAQGRRFMNGGIICHGQGGETFSVELCPKKGIYWSIHT